MSEEGHFATTNILVVGTGGQGVMTATEILAEAAIALGHDVKKTEVAGMAARRGRLLAPALWPQGALATGHAGVSRCRPRF